MIEESAVKIDELGNKRWYNSAKLLHRVDGPAVERAYGTKEWFVNGKCHRIDGPAIEEADGSNEWWFESNRHRVDGPAIEYADGSKYWYLNGKRHREYGPAIELADGCKEWWVNGELHRIDGPAIEDADGSKEWYLNGERHRVDGPAVEGANGGKAWFVNGVGVPEWLVMIPSCDIDPKELFKIRNAQARSEFVKKVGINRILTAFKAQIIESMGIYELLILQIGKRKRPYLRMQNPSTGEYHIEGVRPRCTTIKEALNYRNGLKKDQIDEINGEYMYQQGDVVLKPVGAKKFKSVPSILT